MHPRGVCRANWAGWNLPGLLQRRPCVIALPSKALLPQPPTRREGALAARLQLLPALGLKVPNRWDAGWEGSWIRKCQTCFFKQGPTLQ